MKRRKARSRFFYFTLSMKIAKTQSKHYVNTHMLQKIALLQLESRLTLRKCNDKIISICFSKLKMILFSNSLAGILTGKMEEKCASYLRVTFFNQIRKMSPTKNNHIHYILHKT